MKKFFIVLCGILIMGNAFGYRDVQIPKKITDSSILNAWGSKFDDWNSYTIDVYSAKPKYVFAPDWQFNTKAGTYGTNGAGAEGSIVAIIARDIWKNGGRFCTTQIQAAESGSNDWIDYHSVSEYKCENICRPGYSGDKCAENKFDCDNMNVNYLNNLDDVKNASLRLLSGKQEHNITEYIDVFHYVNDNASNYSYAMVLGVLERRQHSVLVAPVRVLADDGKMDSAHAKSTGPILLCAPGYVASDSITKDCVVAPQCGGSDKDFCTGETNEGYNEDQHEWQISGCKKFRCKNNKGFKSVNDKTCVECPGGALAYIKDDGTCGICNKGEIANATRDNCINEAHVKQYSKDQMKSNGTRQCWLETDGRKFSGCVHECSDTTACYINDACKACD